MGYEPGVSRIVIRVPTELYQRLDDKRHGDRISFQALGLRLLEQWLESNGSPPEDDALGKLREVLASGDDLVIAAVRQNIDVFFDRLRPRKRGRAV